MRFLAATFAVMLMSMVSVFGKGDEINLNPDTVTDFDGNVYHTVTIGTQVWMVENLKTKHFRNGATIANVTGNKDWSELSTAAFCNFRNDIKKGDLYGRLYNWYAVADKRNICPEGWHVPTDGEWQRLIEYLGGEFVAGGKLKESGIAHWSSPNIEATNASGFTALPAGSRDNGNGAFNHTGTYTYFWSASGSRDSAWGYNLSFYYAGIGHFEFDKTFGISVRCIKD
jgi:uncharacterized protein (TIGR02145 family)